MPETKELTINEVLDLAEQHNTMGQFVQQELHEFRTEKRTSFGEVSKVRIISFLQECTGVGIEGAKTLLEAVKKAPTTK